MRRLIVCLFACAALLPTGTVSAQKSGPPVVVVPCGVTSVPFSVYRLPLTANSALTMTLQASGAPDGQITFTAQNFAPNGFYWTRTGGNCGSCSLTLPQVPATREGVQLAVDVNGGACPGPGVTVTGFALAIGPAQSARR